MASLFHDIYKGKKVLVTGHTGFKGSWLALWLKELGADVIGYSLNAPSNPYHFEFLNLDMHSITGDIRDENQFDQAIKTTSPDIIFHLAAQPIVRESYARPQETFATNIMGTVNLLESARQHGGIKAIVNITSDKCYHNNETSQAYKEDDALGGYDPYSASKGAAEIVANSYRHAFFHPDQYGKSHDTLLADVRAGNVIGGGDWAKDRLVPDVMRAASADQKVVIRRPNATRPWQHVLEPLSGYLHLGSKLLQGKKEFADNWNFGPDDTSSLTVHEVINQVQKHWDKIQYEIQEDPTDLHEAHLLTLDSSKARQQLNWRPVWGNDASFAHTAQWYKDHCEQGRIASHDDLSRYINDAQSLGIEWAVQ